MTTVLHYVEHWLELSAGFVHAQVTRSRHRAVVVSHNAAENLDAFAVPRLWELRHLHRLTPERQWPNVRTLALQAAVAAYRARVVHVHFGYVAGDVVPLVRRTGVPLVVSLHGHDVTALPRRQPAHYAEVADVAAAAIVPSAFLAEVVVALGFDDDRVHVIPSGVDTSWHTPSPLPSRPSVAFVGRLVEKKGIDVLLRAWPSVLARVPRATLRVLGDGPLAPLLRDAGASVAHVRPDPARRNEQVREVLRAARVVATPSRTAGDGDAESLLLVNLEAQASGRPVVTTRHGGIPEFVAADESALLVPENDADALAAALVRVLDDDALASRLAEHGPVLAARFDVGRCTAAVDDLYDRVAERPLK